jgi:hypothetical protein
MIAPENLARVAALKDVNIDSSPPIWMLRMSKDTHLSREFQSSLQSMRTEVFNY